MKRRKFQDDMEIRQGIKQSNLISNVIGESIKVKVTLIIVVAVLIVVGAWIVFKSGWVFGERNDSRTETLRSMLEKSQDLVTQKAYITEVQVIDESNTLLGLDVPFTNTKQIYSYDVEVQAGFDLSTIKWTVDEEKRVITVDLPPAKLLSSKLDENSFKVYHDSESIFKQVSLEENHEYRLKILEHAEESAKKKNLLEEAREHAKNVLTAFFLTGYQSGNSNSDEYKVEFRMINEPTDVEKNN
ncbi:MAG: DUF4230 domain-containing protein [Eubacteriales bacterium]|nr:DUF4230 domain-containing protein [Eubacteriales bacterium]